MAIEIIGIILFCIMNAEYEIYLLKFAWIFLKTSKRDYLSLGNNKKWSVAIINATFS